MIESGEIVSFFPHKVIENENEKYLFLGHNSALFKINGITDLILESQGSSIEDIISKATENNGLFSEEAVLDEINDLKKNKIIITEDNNQQIEERYKSFFLHSNVNNLILMICQECNLRCNYCYAGDGEYENKGIMPVEVGMKAIDLLFENNLDKKDLTITYFGGEPLMDFQKIVKLTHYSIDLADRHKVKVSFAITTNGTLLNDEITKFLKDNNFSITLSLDGDRETNNYNRFYPNGAGAYDHTVEKSKSLCKEYKVTARATVTNVNTDVFDRWKHLNTLYFNNIHLSPSVNMMNNSDYDSMILHYKEAIDYFIECIRKKNYKEIKSMGFIEKLFEKVKHGGIRVKNCGAANNMYAVDINGFYYPCHRLISMEEYRIGSIYGGINEEKNSEIESSMLINKYEQCNKCWLSSFCCGGCVQENIAMMGISNKPYYNSCKFMKEIAEYTIKKYVELSKEGLLSHGWN